MALADDIERLQERHPGLHHGGHLAREQGHVLFRYLAAAAGLLLLDLFDTYAMPAQARPDDGLATGAHIALDHLTGLVLTFPAEADFLYPVFGSGSGCCHGDSFRNRADYSSVTAITS